MTRIIVLALALAATACATTLVPSRDRNHVEILLTNQVRQLRSSVVVTPFFRDDSRRLLLKQPPEEVELIVTPRGQPIAPGTVLEVLPAGTRVRVMSVRFPTGWETFSRPLMTPSERPWVEVAIEGRAAKPAYTFVLRPDVRTEDEVVDEIEKWITTTDIAAEVARLPAVDRQVITSREFSPGASRRALELAFGKPLLTRIRGEGTSVLEEWIWRSDASVQRVVYVTDGFANQLEIVPPAARRP